MADEKSNDENKSGGKPEGTTPIDSGNLNPDNDISNIIEGFRNTRKKLTGNYEPKGATVKNISDSDIGISKLEVSDIVTGLNEYKLRFLDIRKELNSHVEKKKGEVFEIHYEPGLSDPIEVPVKTYKTLWGLIGSETKTIQETVRKEIKTKVELPYDMQDAVNLVEENCRNIEGAVEQLEKLVDRVSANTDELTDKVTKGYYEFSEACIACRDSSETLVNLEKVQVELAKEMNKIDWYNPNKPIIREELIQLRSSINKATYEYLQNGDKAIMTKNFVTVLDKFQDTLENAKYDTGNKINKFTNLVRGLRAVLLVGDNIYTMNSLVADACGYTADALDDVAIVTKTSSKSYNEMLVDGNMQITSHSPADLVLMDNQANKRKTMRAEQYNNIKNNVNNLTKEKYTMD